MIKKSPFFFHQQESLLSDSSLCNFFLIYPHLMPSKKFCDIRYLDNHCDKISTSHIVESDLVKKFIEPCFLHLNSHDLL